MLRRSSLILLLSLTLALGCSSEEDPTGGDVGVDDVAEDIGDDSGDDVADEDVDAGGPEGCEFTDQCADDEFCFEGECTPSEACTNPAQPGSCRLFFGTFDEDLSEQAFCDGELCRLPCITDQECSPGNLCTDDGICREFTSEITGEHPGGDQRAPLQAGVGNALMHFPVGLPLGGYGSRASTNDGRYGQSLAQSQGKMHGLFARAIAVDNGERQLIFMRAPIIFPSMALHEAVARNLQEQTGRDWRSSLAISATHTHSGPARFWQIPDLGLGMMGIGEYHDQAFDWLVDSLTEAALDALEDLSPARMGWTVVESFDVDDVISSHRWGETPTFDDNRVLLLRVDDDQGNPRAVLTSFGSHGTVHTGPYANGDVFVGAERMLEYALGEEFGRFVPVMYFNQNGGSMAPRGGANGHRHTQRYENLGAYLVDRTFEALVEMETTDDWDLGGHTHRFPIHRDLLDYHDDEFADHRYGALMCNPSVSGDDHVHSYPCLMGIHTVANNRPFTLLQKSQISAFSLNELTLVTAPGELAMALGWQIQSALEEAYEISPFHSFTWGYAQDHLLYLLPTNLRGELPPFPGISTPEAPDDYPDYTFSYLQGGYEANMSPWGHNLGDFLVDRAVEAVGLMLGEDIEPALPPTLPDQFTRLGDEAFPVDTSSADEVGVILEAPEGQVERRQPVEVVWRGGDPGAEMPQAPRVTLERQVDEDFEPVMLPNQRPYDNREFVMLTRLRQDAQDRWEWVVYWEDLVDFPTGTYRFQIDGHYLDETTEERTPYQVSTEPFELVPTTAMIIDELVAVDATTVSFRLSYPAARELQLASPPEGVIDPGKVQGSYRMHHRDVPTNQPIAVDPDHLDADLMDITIDAGPGQPIDVADLSASTALEGSIPRTRVTVTLTAALPANQAVDITIDAADLLQNSGTLSTTLEFTP